jgi:hypothetical protein
MNGILLVDKPKGWTSLVTETNLRFFSSRGVKSAIFTPAALFPKISQKMNYD